MELDNKEVLHKPNIHNILLSRFNRAKRLLQEYEDKCIEINLTLNENLATRKEILLLNSKIQKLSPELVSSQSSSDGGESVLQLYGIRENVIDLLQLLRCDEEIQATVLDSMLMTLLCEITNSEQAVYFHLANILFLIHLTKKD